MVHSIEDFFGCYLLYSTNPKFKGRTYIGFTVNPKRRIAQHNAGRQKGGAWRTSGRGPWDMTLIVHGFPSDIAALGFEWAWQHPESSRRLRHVPRKNRKETPFVYRVRVLASMLSARPWCIMPLTVRWLQQKYCIDLIPSPPQHIAYAYGLVDVIDAKKEQKKAKAQDNGESQSPKTLNSQGDINIKEKTCHICLKLLPKSDLSLSCYADSCGSSYHVHCLASRFLNDCPTEILPVEGPCPGCNEILLWGELIRKSKGFSQYIDDGDDDFES